MAFSQETITALGREYDDALKVVTEVKQQRRVLKLAGLPGKIDSGPLTVIRATLDSLTKALEGINDPNQDGPNLVVARLRKKVGTLQRCLLELDPVQKEEA
ncbi:MAG: hypothetical protein WC843_03795 [Candidatus Gracilibacteria bacterium]|jgi:hypothetical protein